jgi:hypothetical protein
MEQTIIVTENKLYFIVSSVCMNCGSNQLSYENTSNKLKQKCHDCDYQTEYRMVTREIKSEIYRLFKERGYYVKN